MEVAIIAALVTALLGALGYLIREWAKGVRDDINRHDILHEDHKNNHGLHEVKIATIVAQHENLTKTVEEVHDDVKELLRRGNGNRGTGEA